MGRRGPIACLLTAAVLLLWLGSAAAAAPTLPGELCNVEAREAWSETEAWIWSRVCVGEIADLNERDGKTLDPTSPDGWSADHRLSARFLETILLHDPYRDALPRQGVRIVGALFTEPVDLGEAELAHQLWLDRSRFETDVSFNGLRTPHLVSFDGSVVAGALAMNSASVGGHLFMRDGAEFADVDLGSARIGGQLSLDGATVAGALDMGSARIDGDLLMGGGRFHDVVLRGTELGGWLSLIGATVAGALDLNGAAIAGDLFMRDGAEFADVDLGGARIGGQLSLDGAAVAGTLNMGGASVGGGLFMRDGRFEDRIDLIFANLGSNLDLRGAKIVHLDLTGARIGGELRLASPGWLPLWSKGGRLSLRNVRADAIQDRPGAWPEQVVLGGFAYERLGGLADDTDPLARAGGVGWYTYWLKKDGVYAREPYEQLARVLRNMGHIEAATDVLYAARERERAKAEGPRSLGLTLLNYTIGYGYGLRYFRALIWVVALVLLGALVLRLTGQREPGGGARLGVWYSLDALLPIIELSKRHEDVELTGFARTYFHLHRIMGFVLASFLVAGLTGLAK